MHPVGLIYLNVWWCTDLQNPKSSDYISVQWDRKSPQPCAWLSDSTQSKQVIWSVSSSHRTELPVARIVKQHLYFRTSDQLSFYAFFENVRSHPSILISYCRNYTRNMEWKPTDVTILFVYCWMSTCFGPTGPSSGDFVQLFTQPLVQYLCRSVRVLCMLWPVLVTTYRAREQSGTDTEPMVQYLCRSVRVLCMLWPVLVTTSRALYVVACLGDNIQSTRTEQHRYWTNGCVNSRTNSPEDGPVGPKHLEIQQYTNKIVTSVGFQSICWKDARYKKLKTYTRSFDKIWSRVPTLYFWGKFHINPYGSSTRYKKAGLSNEYRKVLVTINKHVYSKACVQRNKRQTLIVSLFSLLFLNQN